MPCIEQSAAISILQGAKRIYLASPWFNPRQMERMLAVLAVLRDWEAAGEHRKVYAPYIDLLCKPDASLNERRKIYEANVREVSYAHIVVAVTDEKDLGTIYELGYAACSRDRSSRYTGMLGVDDYGPLLVGVALTLGDNPFNLMLAEGLDAVCKSLHELRDLLFRFKVCHSDNQIE